MQPDGVWVPDGERHLPQMPLLYPLLFIPCVPCAWNGCLVYCHEPVAFALSRLQADDLCMWMR